MFASNAVRVLPREFVEASQTGGVYTLVAYAAMFAIVLKEFSAFLSVSYSTLLLMDRRDSDSLQINFDIDLYDIECRNLNLMVWSASGEERITVSEDFQLHAIDMKGRRVGTAIKPTSFDGDDEGAYRAEVNDLVKEDGKDELDSDWASSHDGFKHNHFDHVLKSHDFTFINFFAGWCSHCRQFSPSWGAIAKKVNGEGDTPARQFPDRDGAMHKVRLIKMNCVDFQQLCNEKGIDAYPNLRLYRSDGTFSLFEGRRNEEELVGWIEKTVKMKSYGWAKHHDDFERGCNAKGRLLVPRLPGHLELTAGAGDQNLNIKMTNVSHLVQHLSFSNPGEDPALQKRVSGVPQNFVDKVAPLDGKTFVTESFHQAWIHDMKIISTVAPSGKTLYQISHQKRLSQIPDTEIPQAQLHYDIEPFSIWVRRDVKTWYSFGTSLMAILGGAYVVMRLMAKASLTVVSTMPASSYDSSRKGILST